MTAYETLLGALADPTRRLILARLRSGPTAVGELARALPISQPAVSQHLRVLREAGLVTSTPMAQRRLYRLTPEGLQPLREYLEGFWGDVLDAYAGSFRKGGRAGKTGKGKAT